MAGVFCSSAVCDCRQLTSSRLSAAPICREAMGLGAKKPALRSPNSVAIFFPRISSPFCFVFFAFLGFPVFSTNQAKKIFFCWGPDSSQVFSMRKSVCFALCHGWTTCQSGCQLSPMEMHGSLRRLRSPFGKRGKCTNPTGTPNLTHFLGVTRMSSGNPWSPPHPPPSPHPTRPSHPDVRPQLFAAEPWEQLRRWAQAGGSSFWGWHQLGWIKPYWAKPYQQVLTISHLHKLFFVLTRMVLGGIYPWRVSHSFFQQRFAFGV